MSKERLEEAKRWASEMPALIKNRKDKQSSEHAKERFALFMWLIEQAELMHSHSPDGRNYTNEQYVNLLNERNNYIERVEELEKKAERYRILWQEELGISKMKTMDSMKNTKSINEIKHDDYAKLLNRVFELEKQNKHYREAWEKEKKEAKENG